MKVTLSVNGRAAAGDIAARTSLADFVREHLHLTGTHLGCEHGVCGACTVSINGETARSCITFAAQCEGARVTTIEGFVDDPLMARLRQAFKAAHALQCGYCTPGMLVAGHDLIRRKGGLDAAGIRREMSGNLCRCTGYVGIVAAIGQVMAERDGLIGGLAATSTQLGNLPAELATVGASARDTALRTTSKSEAADPSRHLDWIQLDPFHAERAQQIEESVVIQAPREVVWRTLGDLEQMAACLPGATLYNRKGQRAQGGEEQFTGLVRVKVGPIAAAFAGRGTVTRSDADWTGTVDGQGEAKDSASRLRGRMTYRLAEDGPERTRIAVAIAYTLTGPLAQFSRGDIVADLVRQIARAFAGNLEAQINGRPGAAPQAEIRAGGMLLSVLWARVKRWLGLSQ